MAGSHPKLTLSLCLSVGRKISQLNSQPKQPTHSPRNESTQPLQSYAPTKQIPFFFFYRLSNRSNRAKKNNPPLFFCGFYIPPVLPLPYLRYLHFSTSLLTLGTVHIFSLQGGRLCECGTFVIITPQPHIILILFPLFLFYRACDIRVGARGHTEQNGCERSSGPYTVDSRRECGHTTTGRVGS